MTHFIMSFEDSRDDARWEVAARHRAIVSWAGERWRVTASPLSLVDCLWFLGDNPLPLVAAAALPLDQSWLWLQPYEAVCTIGGLYCQQMGVPLSCYDTYQHLYGDDETALLSGEGFAFPHPSHAFGLWPADAETPTLMPLYRLPSGAPLPIPSDRNRMTQRWRQQMSLWESRLMPVSDHVLGLWANARIVPALVKPSYPEIAWSNGYVERGVSSLSGRQNHAATCWAAMRETRANCAVISCYTRSLWRDPTAALCDDSPEAIVAEGRRFGDVSAVYYSSQQGTSWCLSPVRGLRRFFSMLFPGMAERRKG